MSITAVLDRLGIVYDLRGDEASSACPMHRDSDGRRIVDHHPSWSMNTSTGLMHCWSCGYGGDLTRLVADLRSVTQEEAQQWIAEDDVDPQALRRRWLALARREQSRVVPVSEAVLMSMDDPSPEMLESRRITAEVAAVYGIRAQKGRWILPIRNQGHLLGWQVKDKDFVRNYPVGVNKGRTLFGAELPFEHVVLVESPLDAALLYRLGIPAVASYGDQVSDDQIDLLENYNGLTLALDNDHSGQRSTKKLSKKLAQRGRFHRIVEWDIPAKDFGESTDEDCIRLCTDAPFYLKRRLDEIIKSRAQ